MTITVFTHTDCLAHDPGNGHPESPMRLSVVLSALDGSSLRQAITYADAPLGTDAQLTLAHDPAHVERVRETAPASGEAALDADTRMSPGSLNAALRCIGGACQGVDDLFAGTSDRVFLATRPPGHHATPTHAMGFCLFNHVAVAALYAQQQHNLKRVAIVDFDVHHGNGTQDIMAGRDGMFYISTHQSPLYPGTGHEVENRPQNILNVPLPGGTGHTAFLEVFEEKVLAALLDYRPQLLLVSAGFDAHASDPLAGMALTDDTYHWLGQTLNQVAGEHCEGRILSVLEGGYNLDALPGSVLAYLDGLLA